MSASWAANGVRINAVAPGNVSTAMTATMSTSAKMALNALPIPTKYGQECLMEADEIAEVMVFLASDAARGVNGNVMFVDGGTDALVVLGTTGEPATMTEDEKTEVIKFAVKYAAGRIKIIIGTGSNDTAKAVAASQRAEKLGADGVLVVTPYYNKCTQKGLYDYQYRKGYDEQRNRLRTKGARGA